MNEAQSDIYRKLQKHLDKFPIGFPPTESGIEIELLKHLFSPDEAKIACKLSDSYEPSEIIYERVNDIEISVHDLTHVLDKMVKKGAIHYKTINGKRYYANAYLLIGMYEYQINKLTEEFYNDFWSYAYGPFMNEVFGTQISQFRTVPVEKSITPEHYIPTYDELRKIIENTKGPIGVAECICRQGKKMIGESCKMTSRLETCIGFGDMAQLYNDQGWGREVSKEEALQIIQKNEEEGLVLQAFNTINPEFICSCCGCCCGMLSNCKILPQPAKLLSSTFQAEIDLELCQGCGTCVDRCQMNAIKLRKGIAKLNKKKCIGCGNCVPTCPVNAIQLNKKEKIDIPFETKEQLYSAILERKKEMTKI